MLLLFSIVRKADIGYAKCEACKVIPLQLSRPYGDRFYIQENTNAMILFSTFILLLSSLPLPFTTVSRCQIGTEFLFATNKMGQAQENQTKGQELTLAY